MRISDWSSDVCSSDLWRRTTRRQGTHHRQKAAERGIVIIGSPDGREGQDILRVADRLEHDIRINHGGTGFANNTKAKAPARPSRTRSIGLRDTARCLSSRRYRQAWPSATDRKNTRLNSSTHTHHAYR